MTEGWPPALQGPRIGPARTARLYPWRSLADAGTTLLFGSDMPSSEQDDPISGIYGAVARRTQSKVFVPAERVDASLALRAFTSGPAAALGMGDRLGRLAPGHAADVVMLARDPRAGATSIADDPVQQMWIGGTRVTP